MKLLLVLGLILSIAPCFATLANWKLVQDSEKSKLWLAKNNYNITGALQIDSVKRNINWNHLQSKEFIERVSKRKKKTLRFMGITNWILNNYKWTKIKDVYKLEMIGTYSDPAGVKTFFKEIHIYSKSKKIQILHSRPFTSSEGKFLEQEIITHMLKVGKAVQ